MPSQNKTQEKQTNKRRAQNPTRTTQSKTRTNRSMHSTHRPILFPFFQQKITVIQPHINESKWGASARPEKNCKKLGVVFCNIAHSFATPSFQYTTNFHRTFIPLFVFMQSKRIHLLHFLNSSRIFLFCLIHLPILFLIHVLMISTFHLIHFPQFFFGFAAEVFNASPGSMFTHPRDKTKEFKQQSAQRGLVRDTCDKRRIRS